MAAPMPRPRPSIAPRSPRARRRYDPRRCRDADRCRARSAAGGAWRRSTAREARACRSRRSKRWRRSSSNAKNGKFVLAAMRTEVDGDARIEGTCSAVGGMVTAYRRAQATWAKYGGALGGDAGLRGAGRGRCRARAAGPRAPGGVMKVQRRGCRGQAGRAPRARFTSEGRASPSRQRSRPPEEPLGDELEESLEPAWPWPASIRPEGYWKEIKADSPRPTTCRSARSSTTRSPPTRSEQHPRQPLRLVLHRFGADRNDRRRVLRRRRRDPGCVAGAAFAGEVGEALVAAARDRAAVIIKSVADSRSATRPVPRTKRTTVRSAAARGRSRSRSR